MRLKKYGALLLALCMVMAILPVSASAAGESSHHVIDRNADALIYGLWLNYQDITFTIDAPSEDFRELKINGVLVEQPRDIEGPGPIYTVSEKDGNMVVAITEHFFVWPQWANTFGEKNEIEFVLADGSIKYPFTMIKLKDNYTGEKYYYYYYGSEEGLTVRTNANNDRLQQVYIGFNLVAPEYYTVSDNGSSITISSEYLDELFFNDYSLVLIYENGDASGSISVEYDYQDEYSSEVVDGGIYDEWFHNRGDLTVKIAASHSKFVGLYDSGKRPVEDGNYKASEGPDNTTLITFTKEFLMEEFSKYDGKFDTTRFTALFDDGSSSIRITDSYEVLEGKENRWNATPDLDKDLVLVIDSDDELQSVEVTGVVFGEVEDEDYLIDWQALSEEDYSQDQDSQGNAVVTIKGDSIRKLYEGHDGYAHIFFTLQFSEAQSSAFLIIAPFTSGDFTGDGETNNKDVSRLLQDLSGWEVETIGNADVNNDGSVNNKDVSRLLQYLSGWEVTIY